MTKNFYFIKEDKVLSKDFTNELLIKFDQIYARDMYKNVSPTIRELVYEDILKEPLFNSLLKKIQKKFELLIGKSDLMFLKIWLVYSKSNHTNKNILPYIPHIDRLRKLKAMVYLHDIQLEHGPIHLGKVKKEINIEQKRNNLPEDFQEKGLNSIDEDHLENILTPMVGGAGDIVFFDTNTPHKAGIVKEGFYRKVLRFDFERPNYNPKQTILKRLINRFK